jgi:outer membrane protein TolC
MVDVKRAGRLLASVSMAALLTACAVTPEPFTKEEVSAQAVADREAMFKGGEPLTGPLTLPEAIARAMKYNLDKRSKMMEEALALGQTELDRWDMLPKLTANAGYTYRSEPNATNSLNTTTGQRSSDYSYSADQRTKTADLTMTWNLLDFGVTYYTAKANADRVLVATEKRRKAVHNLVTEIRFAFWRAAAYQVLNAEVERAVNEAKDALARSRQVEKENLKAPLESLRYRKSLLETLRQLTAVQQELSTASIELAALINVPPGTNLVLDIPDKMKVPAWTMPLERMEELAFERNPDLLEQGYLSRIAIDETKKTILKMLPGITFSSGRNWDGNSFQANNLWWEAGAKLSWNVMNVFSGKSQMDYAETNEEVANSKRVALRMALLAQVHVIERQFHNAVSQFEQSDELWHVDRRLFEISEARTANDAQGILERVAGRASAIASQLRRFQSYAQMDQTYAKILATLGHDLSVEATDAGDLKSLSGAVAKALDNWGKEEVPPVVAVAAETQPVPTEAAIRVEEAPGAAEQAVAGLIGQIRSLYEASGQ